MSENGAGRQAPAAADRVATGSAPADAGSAGREARIVAASPVPSPCTSVCCMNPATGCCEGCGRTIDEIAAWGSLDDMGKRSILDRLARRRGRRVADAGGGPSLRPLASSR